MLIKLAVIRAIWFAINATFTMEKLKPFTIPDLGDYNIKDENLKVTREAEESWGASNVLVVISQKFFPTFTIIIAANNLIMKRKKNHELKNRHDIIQNFTITNKFKENNICCKSINAFCERSANCKIQSIIISSRKGFLFISVFYI